MKSIYLWAYQALCAYQRYKNALRHLIRDPLTLLRQRVIPDNAIQKAVIINTLGCKNTVVYEYTTWSILYHLYLMYIVFGPVAWRERYCSLLTRYRIKDTRVSNPGCYLYVRLMNGKEYLTKQVFDSKNEHFQPKAKAKFLWIQIDSHNVTPFYKRFLASWEAINPTTLDFVILALHFDTNLRSHINFISHSVTAIDDDTCEEKQYKESDYLMI